MLFALLYLTVCVASASADKTIRLWRDGKLESIVRGHTDAGTVFPLSSCSSALSLLVRGLVSVPGIGFASASNDTTIRLWSLAGQQLQEMYNIHKTLYELRLLGTATPSISTPWQSMFPTCRTRSPICCWYPVERSAPSRSGRVHTLPSHPGSEHLMQAMSLSRRCLTPAWCGLSLWRRIQARSSVVALITLFASGRRSRPARCVFLFIFEFNHHTESLTCLPHTRRRPLMCRPSTPKGSKCRPYQSASVLSSLPSPPPLHLTNEMADLRPGKPPPRVAWTSRSSQDLTGYRPIWASVTERTK